MVYVNCSLLLLLLLPLPLRLFVSSHFISKCYICFCFYSIAVVCLFLFFMCIHFFFLHCASIVHIILGFIITVMWLTSCRLIDAKKIWRKTIIIHTNRIQARIYDREKKRKKTHAYTTATQNTNDFRPKAFVSLKCCHCEWIWCEYTLMKME